MRSEQSASSPSPETDLPQDSSPPAAPHKSPGRRRPGGRKRGSPPARSASRRPAVGAADAVIPTLLQELEADRKASARPVGSLLIAPLTLPDGHRDPLEALDVVETNDAQEAAAFWRVEAVGRRPLDHLARDLMYGSLLRDHRPTWFHKYAREQPDWMQDLIAHLPANVQATAAQHVALDYLHRRRLLFQIEQQVGYGVAADARVCRLLGDLWSCCPHGVLVEPRTADRRGVRYYCGHAWHCPWCLARSVTKVYQRLQRGPMQSTAGKHLVLGRVRIASNLGGQSDDDLNPLEAKLIRKRLGAAARQQLTALGVRGGMVSYQLSPGNVPVRANSSATIPGYQHDFAVLGEVTWRDDREEQHFLHGLRTVFAGVTGHLGVYPDWFVIRADDKAALRLMLVGCNPNFNLGRCPSLRSLGRTPQAVLLTKGLTGVLTLPPLFLLNDRQEEFYRIATDKLRMVDFFGAWRGSDHKPDAFLEPSERALYRVNAVRRRDRDQRRKDLACHLAAYLQERTAPARTTGRPPRRQHLAEWLAKNGIGLSTRELRWLMTQLPAS